MDHMKDLVGENIPARRRVLKEMIGRGRNSGVKGNLVQGKAPGIHKEDHS